MIDYPKWASHDGCYGLTLALRNLRDAEQRKPHDGDRPDCTTLPHTAASREALRIQREHDAAAGRKRHRIVNRGGVITREPPPDNVVPITRGRKR